MNTYELKVIPYFSRPVTAEEYNRAWDEAKPIICHGLKEVWNECGGKLHKCRCGYEGTDFQFEYFARRVG